MWGPCLNIFCEQNITKPTKTNLNQPLYFHWNQISAVHNNDPPKIHPFVSTGTISHLSTYPYSLSKVNTCKQTTQFTLVNSFLLTCSHFHIQSHITQFPV